MVATPSKVSIIIDRTHYSPLYMRFAHFEIHLNITLAPFFIVFGFTIIEVLKLSKSMKMYKYDVTTTYIDNINVCDVKYLSPSFDINTLFLFPHVLMVAPWMT